MWLEACVAVMVAVRRGAGVARHAGQVARALRLFGEPPRTALAPSASCSLITARGSAPCSPSQFGGEVGSSHTVPPKVWSSGPLQRAIGGETTVVSLCEPPLEC